MLHEIKTILGACGYNACLNPGADVNSRETQMHTYEQEDILTMCSRDHRLVTDLARSVGIQPKLIKENENKLPAIADLTSKAVCNQPLYTVTVAKLSPNGEIKHEHVLNTLNGWEALQRRVELNEKRPFYGSKEVAQVIRREIMPRQWKLWVQVSPDEVHLRCAWTKARALLRTPTSRLVDRLHRGHTLSQSRAVYLQSEKVELAMESISTRSVAFTKLNGPKISQKVEIRTPIICYLDVNASSELVTDTQCGIVSRHPFEQSDKLILPERLAKALWLEGIILPLEAQIGGKILVQLTDPELRTRLALSRLNLKEHGVSTLGLRHKSSPPPLPHSTKSIRST